MTRQWARRDHDAEHAVIRTAITQMLETLTADSQPPTIKELAEAANLRRDYLYDHKELIAEYKAAVSARTGKSARFIALEEELRRKKEQLDAVRAESAMKDEQIRMLRLVLAETALELEDLKTSVRCQRAVRPTDGRASLSAVRSKD